MGIVFSPFVFFRVLEQQTENPFLILVQRDFVCSDTAVISLSILLPTASKKMTVLASGCDAKLYGNTMKYHSMSSSCNICVVLFNVIVCFCTTFVPSIVYLYIIGRFCLSVYVCVCVCVCVSVTFFS